MTDLTNLDKIGANEVPFSRPVIVGSLTREEIPTVELQYTVNHLGIEVVTDCKELAENLSCYPISTSLNYQSGMRLIYLTNPLNFKEIEGYELHPISLGYPGDIYASRELNTFVYHGVNKYGTLISIMYGLRAFDIVPQGVIGLHSAAIYDREKQITHVLVGKNRVGKSTISQIIEDTDNRFVMISDDWAELVWSNGSYIVRPVSPLFSPGDRTEGYELSFISFGKSFYTKPALFQGKPEAPLGSIIEIGTGTDPDEDINFFVRSQFHVPFIAQNISNLEIPEATKSFIRDRIDGMQKLYDLAKMQVPIHRFINNPSVISLEEASNRVYQLIK